MIPDLPAADAWDVPQSDEDLRPVEVDRESLDVVRLEVARLARDDRLTLGVAGDPVAERPRKGGQVGAVTRHRLDQHWAPRGTRWVPGQRKSAHGGPAQDRRGVLVGCA